MVRPAELAGTGIAGVGVTGVRSAADEIAGMPGDAGEVGTRAEIAQAECLVAIADGGVFGRYVLFASPVCG